MAWNIMSLYRYSKDFQNEYYSWFLRILAEVCWWTGNWHVKLWFLCYNLQHYMFITQQSLHEVNSSEPRALYGGLGQDTRCVGIIGLWAKWLFIAVNFSL